jgi:hypothetical protein
MKLKAIVVGVLVAFAVNAVARPQNGPTERKFPTLPGFPGSPSFPKVPKIPPPGKTNPKGEPGVPFPLSITLPFPWAAIEGLWKVTSSDKTMLFSFSVQTDVDGRQYLHVLQINGAGEVVAEGVGVSVEKDKLVRAAMTSKTDNVNYMLFIGSYKNTGAHAAAVLKSVTVLTVRPFSSLTGAKDVQVMVEKVSNAPIDGGADYDYLDR